MGLNPLADRHSSGAAGAAAAGGGATWDVNAAGASSAVLLVNRAVEGELLGGGSLGSGAASASGGIATGLSVGDDGGCDIPQ